ncbi:MAG TPA: ABC transporter ATP-binding protein [Gallionellaceae bacterium]
MLSVRNLKVSYGGIQALKGVDLEVAEGELVALIGSNGAGKTTTLKAMAGLLSCTGTLHYAQGSLQKIPVHQRVREGLALVPEGRGIFGRMSVAENLEMGAYCRADKPSIAQDLDRVYALFPRLAERRVQLAGTLSGGEQQMVAMGRALMSRPRLLMLDEPSMGLAPLMVARIFETIRAISAQGVAILLVEQNAKLALELASRAYVLESGRVSLTDQAARLLDSEAIQRAYLGT